MPFLGPRSKNPFLFPGPKGREWVLERDIYNWSKALSLCPFLVLRLKPEAIHFYLITSFGGVPAGRVGRGLNSFNCPHLQVGD
jgi:hypothetical protein